MAELEGGPVGHTIYHYPTLSNTMELARTLAMEGRARPGSVILTEEQSAGRGRLQRAWFAPYGTALLMTVIVTPPLLACPLYCLPMLLAIAVAEAIEKTVPPLSGQVWLKWPNDILLGDISSQQQKVAGLLIETIYESNSSYTSETNACALLGVGINVNQICSELPTVQVGKPKPSSLRTYSGYSIEREHLLTNFCKSLGRWLTDTSDYPEHDKHFVNLDSSKNGTKYTEKIYQTWRDRLSTLGQSVIFEQSSSGDTKRCSGIAIDVTPEGALVIQDKNGQCHTFNAGDITLHKHV